jgi:hypothetical protein
MSATFSGDVTDGVRNGLWVCERTTLEKSLAMDDILALSGGRRLY